MKLIRCSDGMTRDLAEGRARLRPSRHWHSARTEPRPPGIPRRGRNLIFRRIARLLVGTTVAIVATGAIARAQADRKQEAGRRAAPLPALTGIDHAEDDWERGEAVEVSRQADLQMLLAEQQRERLQMAYKAQFDRWFSLQFRPRVGARDQLELRLAGRIRELEADCHLSTAQVKKLQLAGRGDIKRYMDRVDKIARAMEDPQSSIDDLRAARVEMRDLDSRASQRLFGDDSLFCKTLAGTLDVDQLAEREKAFRERSVVRNRAAVKSAVKTLQTNLGMNDEQTTRLAELLFKEARPPRKFGNAPDVALVLFQASRIPEGRIRPIFDDAQWRIMGRWMGIYIRGASGEKTLMRNGFVFDDAATVSSPDRVRSVSKKNETRELEQIQRD
jgi:hypothetical protein